MILSFAKTVDDFLSGKKTATRRFFAERTIKMWQKAWDDGRCIHKAYDKSPRNGGKQIGWFELFERPYLQPLSKMTEEDLIFEGMGVYFECEFDPANFPAFVGKSAEDVALVIRFEKCDAPKEWER